MILDSGKGVEVYATDIHPWRITLADAQQGCWNMLLQAIQEALLTRVWCSELQAGQGFVAAWSAAQLR